MYNVRTLGFYVYPERQESQENKGLPDFESSVTAVLGGTTKKKLYASCQE